MLKKILVLGFLFLSCISLPQPKNIESKNVNGLVYYFEEVQNPSTTDALLKNIKIKKIVASFTTYKAAYLEEPYFLLEIRNTNVQPVSVIYLIKNKELRSGEYFTSKDPKILSVFDWNVSTWVSLIILKGDQL